MDDLLKGELVVFDVETTGLSPGTGDRIIEIAALRIRDRKPIEEFHSFINPKRAVSVGAFMVNGITPQMLARAPEAAEIMPRFWKFVNGSHVIGHNVRFDVGFVVHEFSRTNLAWDADTLAICTVRMARYLLPELGSYR